MRSHRAQLEAWYLETRGPLRRLAVATFLFLALLLAGSAAMWGLFRFDGSAQAAAAAAEAAATTAEEGQEGESAVSVTYGEIHYHPHDGSSLPPSSSSSSSVAQSFGSIGATLVAAPPASSSAVPSWSFTVYLWACTASRLTYGDARFPAGSLARLASTATIIALGKEGDSQANPQRRRLIAWRI